MKFSDRLAHAWNAFKNNDKIVYDPPKQVYTTYSSTQRPDRTISYSAYDRSIITAILTRIALDAASVNFSHARTDENGNYVETIKSGLNNCLSLDANTDQTGAAFMKDVIMSMFDEGVVAIVPTDTDLDPDLTGGYDILKLRTGKVVTWYPDYVKVRVYREDKGNKEDILMPKKAVAIVENPLYEVMNGPNSTLQRLIRILNKLDILNEQNASGKMDLIIQLPYTINSDRRRAQAESRRKEVENQLVGSKYGIAYTDGTERITQLNRAVENNMLAQVEYFMKLLYSQLGISENVFNGTANEEELLNYYDRTINPINSALADEMTRKFLTKTARTQRQVIWFFRDPFKLVPVSKLSEIVDTLLRNTILTPNEVRAIIGYKPSTEPQADELQNPNMYPVAEEDAANAEMEEGVTDQNGEELLSEEETAKMESEIDSLDKYDEELDKLEKQLKHDAFDEYDALILSHSELEASLNAPSENPFEFINSLSHYASEYYDPVYAHEYYEAHKKLKGRRMSEKGREIAAGVKKKMTDERNAKIQSSRSKTKSSVEMASRARASTVESSSNTAKSNIEARRNATKKAIEQHKAQMDSQIDSLKDELKAWGASGKKGKSKEIRIKIAKLRMQNSEAKEKLRNDLGEYSLSERSAHKERATAARDKYREDAGKIKESGQRDVAGIKEEYDTKLNAELDKIAAEYPAESSSKKTKESKDNSALAAKINKAHQGIKSDLKKRKK